MMDVVEPKITVTVSWGPTQAAPDPYLLDPPAADPEGLSASQLLITRRKIRSAARRKMLVELDRARAASYGITWSVPD